jgi:tetratricopeptide (TPR) repeat protein
MALNNRCWHRAIAGQLQTALEDCNQSLRLRENDKDVLDSRGLVYLKMKNPDASITDYSAALARDPKMPTSLYGRGLAEGMKGDRAAAAADIAAAKALQPTIADDFVKWGVPAPVEKGRRKKVRAR